MANTSRPNNPQRAGATGASKAEVVTAHDDHSAQDALIGTDGARNRSNVSWGAIFAGVVTFLALTVTLSMASAAMGLGGATGMATGIWTLIALAVSLAVAGYVSGALATRSGLFHGLLTWATSLLAIVVLAGWLGGSLLGSVGNMAGQVVQSGQVNTQQVEDAARQAGQQVQPPTQQQIDQAARDTSTGAWWAFAGTLIGAAGAAAAGAAGARSVIRRDTEVTTAVRK